MTTACWTDDRWGGADDALMIRMRALCSVMGRSYKPATLQGVQRKTCSMMHYKVHKSSKLSLKAANSTELSSKSQKLYTMLG
jgi:hypothetical protein